MADPITFIEQLRVSIDGLIANVDDVDEFNPSDATLSVVPLHVDGVHDSVIALVKILTTITAVDSRDALEDALVDMYVSIEHLNSHWTELTNALRSEGQWFDDDNASDD